MAWQKELLRLASVVLVAVALPLLGEPFQQCGVVATCLCIIQTTSLIHALTCIRKKVHDDDEASIGILGAAIEFFTDRVAPRFLNVCGTQRHCASTLVMAVGMRAMWCLGGRSWQWMCLGGIACGVFSRCVAHAFQRAFTVTATASSDGVSGDVVDWHSSHWWVEPRRTEETECPLADLDTAADVGSAAVVTEVDHKQCALEEMVLGMRSRFLDGEEEQWSFLQSTEDSE